MRSPACAVASRTVSPITRLAIKSLVNAAKNIKEHPSKCVRTYMLWTYCVGKAHGARAAGQYSYCPNHILGDMNNALVLISFTAYSGSAWHFDPLDVHKYYVVGNPNAGGNNGDGNNGRNGGENEDEMDLDNDENVLNNQGKLLSAILSPT